MKHIYQFQLQLLRLPNSCISFILQTLQSIVLHTNERGPLEYMFQCKYNWTKGPFASTILINCIMHLTFYESKLRTLTRNHEETLMSLHSYIINNRLHAVTDKKRKKGLNAFIFISQGRSISSNQRGRELMTTGKLTKHINHLEMAFKG